MKLKNAAACLLMVGSLIAPAASNGQDKTPRASVDDLIDWSDPLALSEQKLMAIFDAHTRKLGRSVYHRGTIDETITDISIGLRDLGKTTFENTLFTGRFEVVDIYVVYSTRTGRIISFGASMSKERLTKKKHEELKAILTQKTGDTKPVPVKLSGDRTGIQWTNPNYLAQLADGPSYVQLRVLPLPSVPSVTKTVAQPQAQPTLNADLDALLNFGSLWQWTPDDFEKNYVLKLEDQKMQQRPPQFEWVSNARSRARFSRHMFSNVETNLTMFGGSTKVEEAILEFVNGKASRATISFYNRGDSGDIEVTEFDRMFKTIGQNLGQVTKVAPKRQIMSANAALPVTGWIWSSPAGIALLEYNEYNTPGKVTKPEFLRLKLAAPNQADWSMGKLAVGVQRMELLKRVTKKPDGDVFISGVPMVDQGQKGYCVAASCQRLFEYMRIPCDQHEMAKLVSVDAESGANMMTMQKSLAKIDGAFKVTFKPLVNPELYYSGNGKRRVSDKEFLSIIKENVEKGVPLLWGLELGRKQEDPPLSRQASGGHMRMVIGYNLAKNQVIFTDSWGAGHELKRMALLDAYDVTMGLYSMAPRGL